jgi:phage shock protein A
MKQMHDKICKDLSDLRARKETIKAKMTLAKTQEKMNKIGSSFDGAADRLAAFDRMEAKADQMLDKANAMAELNQKGEAENSVENLMKKYDSSTETASGVDDELEALKKEMGL